MLRQRETFEERRQQAIKIKTELEKGMERWSEKVVEVQIDNTKKAEEKVQKAKIEKELKVREDRIDRERRVIQIRSKSKEREKNEIKEKVKLIEIKKQKVNNFNELFQSQSA